MNAVVLVLNSEPLLAAGEAIAQHLQQNTLTEDEIRERFSTKLEPPDGECCMHAHPPHTPHHTHTHTPTFTHNFKWVHSSESVRCRVKGHSLAIQFLANLLGSKNVGEVNPNVHYLSTLHTVFVVCLCACVCVCVCESVYVCVKVCVCVCVCV